MPILLPPLLLLLLQHTIFGEVAEGMDVLESISEAPCDDDGRPLQNIRIRHTIVLDDPMPDPPGLQAHIPDASPPPQVPRAPPSLLHLCLISQPGAVHGIAGGT